MLSAKQIAAIHVAKNMHGVDESQYRLILREAAGVSSSKAPELGNREFGVIMDALKSHRQGWQGGQIRKFRQYAGFAGISLQEARNVLYKATWIMSEESPELKQSQFEFAMASLEETLEARIKNGQAELPKGLSIDYWRGRLPGKQLSSRQLWEINNLWQKIGEYLPEEKRSSAYLEAILSKACGIKVGNVEDLPGWVATKAVEALKLKLKQEQAKMAEEVPF